MLADQIHASRRAKHAHSIRRVEYLAEGFRHERPVMSDVAPGRRAAEGSPEQRHEKPAVQIDIGRGKSRARVRREDSHGEQQHACDSEKPADGES